MAAPNAHGSPVVFASDLNFPLGIAIDGDGNVFVADGDNTGANAVARVKKYNSSGTLIQTIGTPGSGAGQLNFPMDVALDASGNLYVLENGNHRISKFAPNGTFVSSFGSYGTGCPSSAAFDFPRGLEVRGSRLIVTSDARCVQEFDTSGNFVRKWGSDGSGAGQFQNTSGAAIDSSGRVFVGDATRVQRFSSTGVFEAQWVTGNDAGWPTIDQDDRVYITDSATSDCPTRMIRRYTTSWSPLGSTCAGARINGPVALAPDGDLLATYWEAGSGRVLRFDLRNPTAELTVSEGRTVTGEAVTLDASRSEMPMGRVTTYEWDLDSDGSYEKTTDIATTDVSFSSVGRRAVGVRVTGSSGRTATAQASVDVSRAPPPGVVGVSINAGAQFTNDPSVEVRPVWPRFTTTLTISNDGGFAGSAAFPVDAGVRWRLDSSGPERLPKTVYVRFDGATQTFQDDIILDETSPVVRSASLAGVASATVARARSYGIRVRASDKTSGVAKAQVASNKRKPLAIQNYAARLKVKAKSRPRWVRVQDRAGNWSSWKKLK